MSTPINEVKAAASATEATFVADVATAKLEVKTWYEKHLPAIVGVLGGLLGWVVGHYVR